LLMLGQCRSWSGACGSTAASRGRRVYWGGSMTVIIRSEGAIVSRLRCV